MIEVQEEVLQKHLVALEAARRYWVLNQPTGLSDQEFDRLEREARADGLELRDYVCQEIQGQRAKNADYITKVPKTQVQGDMLEAVREFTATYRANTGNDIFWIPKYDGSSLAAYYDTTTGKCVKVITVGGSNLGGDGIDQTKKFARYFPNLPGTGICAVQAECLVALEHGFAESSRQKANGLVNSKYLDSEVDVLVGIRGFRYYLDPECPYSQTTSKMSYQEVLDRIPAVMNLSGDIKFCGGYVMTLQDLELLGPAIVDKDIWKTPSGTFLVDGLVAYTREGVCIQALKYKDAGRGETTEVLGIKWNDQSVKGKDSWSANAIIKEVTVRGSKCTKPTVGSVKKMVETGLSKGAKVTIILANSTIPQVSNVMSPGNLDFEWPTCGCGYRMGPGDIYGALLKCGNPMCTERLGRMRKYLESLTDPMALNLDKFLVLDRFKWAEKVDIEKVIPAVWEIVDAHAGPEELYKYLEQFLTTPLQKRNLALVIGPAYKALEEQS
jgi:hypothetical protein